MARDRSATLFTQMTTDYSGHYGEMRDYFVGISMFANDAAFDAADDEIQEALIKEYFSRVLLLKEYDGIFEVLDNEAVPTNTSAAISSKLGTKKTPPGGD